MLKIISGAQTGVDRAVLDVALKHGVPCGGWCPAGRKAEDGVIPSHYPVQELMNGGYEARTRKNVQVSDGTVIVHFGRPGGGTKKTLQYCQTEKKPCLLLDGRDLDTEQAARRIIEFERLLPNGTINFAGPRASEEPGAYAYTLVLVDRFLALYHGKHS